MFDGTNNLLDGGKIKTFTFALERERFSYHWSPWALSSKQFFRDIPQNNKFPTRVISSIKPWWVMTHVSFSQHYIITYLCVIPNWITKWLLTSKISEAVNAILSSVKIVASCMFWRSDFLFVSNIELLKDVTWDFGRNRPILENLQFFYHVVQNSILFFCLNKWRSEKGSKLLIGRKERHKRPQSADKQDWNRNF